MENRLKATILVAIFTFTKGCLAQNSVVSNCQPEAVLENFLGTDSSWNLLRDEGDFSPILGLKVRDSKLWVSTYGSDYYPAMVRATKNSFFIENIRFRRPFPVKVEGDPANLVRDYKKDSVVFVIPLNLRDCGIDDAIQIDALNVSGEGKETFHFIRSED